MRFGPRRLHPAVLSAGIAVLVIPSQAGAVPLDQGTCAQLMSEQAQLIGAGVKDSMARGPNWAGAGASLMRLKEIERLIEVEEQLKFRCPLPKPVEPAEAGGGASEGTTNAAAAKRATTVPAPVRKPNVNDAYVPPSPKPKPASGKGP